MAKEVRKLLFNRLKESLKEAQQFMAGKVVLNTFRTLDLSSLEAPGHRRERS